MGEFDGLGERVVECVRVVGVGIAAMRMIDIAMMIIDVSTLAINVSTWTVNISTKQLLNIPAIDLASAGSCAKKRSDPEKTEEVGLEWREEDRMTISSRRRILWEFRSQTRRQSSSHDARRCRSSL